MQSLQLFANDVSAVQTTPGRQLLPLVHAVGKNGGGLHHVKADRTFRVLFLPKIRKDALGVHLAVPGRVVAFVKPLDQLVDVDSAAPYRCLRGGAVVGGQY